jgi:hypothetical protein
MTTSDDLTALLTPRPLEDWHEDLGPQLWWTFPLSEAPYVGSPLDSGQTVEIVVRYYRQGKVYEKLHRHHVGEWPGYHTHFTPIPHIIEPPAAEVEEEPIPIAQAFIAPDGPAAFQVSLVDALHPTWDGLKLSQRQRCSRAVMHVRMYDQLSRKDIMSMGQVSAAQASNDIKEIQQRCPGLMHYDTTRKRYVLTSRK